MTLEHSFSFYAQHHIEAFPMQHGHAYRLTVFIEGEPDDGVMFALDELGRIVSEILKRYQGANLNTFIMRPTLENIAVQLMGQLKGRVPGLSRIRLARDYDTATTIEVS